ncbi:YhcN/YlaJ family sporulation lipoprotein [Falsibacillus pallidus]|uniref:Sporulation lipoprotein YhcN/YlaJ n=1 Tax=Falsibacillus pallidus TaxID=493781 RepID=A0A370GW21_9BACI|nr:YhcN/YlaJ family sporulation lipoprotein [Falsibacillus pallidus]RDI47741.1 sporulation lipoprotein YhcN/YlaJ [Falsibacillus pallidus]
MKIGIVILCVSLLAAGGCSSKPKHDSQLALIKTTNPEPIELKVRPDNKSIGARVKHEIDSIPEVYDAAVIEGKDEIIVAYKVKHSKRFRMKKIEKKINSRLEKEYPDENFIVSSDYKIFLEAIRLKEEMEADTISKKDASKRFEEIKELQMEQT